MDAGLYIHIPFCVKKCAYCDFLSFACGADTRERYVEALIEEIRAYRNKQTYEVPTIFLGGGTPSVLEKCQLERILDAVYEVFAVQPDAEVSMEMNPGSVDSRHFALPGQINRVSIGLQSANDAELKKLGRMHTFGEFVETYKQVRAAGIANINVDLISAIPDQNLQSWERTLVTTADLEPEHISAYSLIVEEGTPFAGMKLNLPGEDEERQIYARTEEILSARGYERYEISNYAKKGYACRHNISYWKRENYLGLGLGAASLLDNCRFHNTASMERYLRDSGCPESLREEVQILDWRAVMEEYMFLGLRMMEGVSEAGFVRDFGQDIRQVYGGRIAKLEKQGLLEAAGGRLRLTGRGIDVSNYVMSEFLLD